MPRLADASPPKGTHGEIMNPGVTASDETLNERLRRRREEFGASIGQVAAWAGIEPGRLKEIEAGSPIRSWEFDAICRALAVDSGALASGRDRTPRRSVARFKAASWVDPTPEDYRTLSLAAELGRIGGFLGKSVHQWSRLASMRSPEPVVAGMEPWKQGYRLGENTRRSLAPQPGPIRNLESLLKNLGVHVARVEFSSKDLDAASLWERDSLPIILLNSRSGRSRSSLSRRALLAHELCHLLHDSGETDLTTQLSWSENTGNYNEEIEQRARAFAPAFLAPRDEVRHWFRADSGQLIHDPQDKVRKLARRWGFSLRGAIWHAKNCDLIQADDAESMSRNLPDEDHAWSHEFETSGQDVEIGGTSELGHEVSPIVRGLLADLVADAATAGVISESRGREIATWK